MVCSINMKTVEKGEITSMEKAKVLFEEHKRTILMIVVAYFLYTIAQYDTVGWFFHIIINTFIFIFISDSILTFAEKVTADKRKKAL